MGAYNVVTACQTENSECWERHETSRRNEIAHFHPVWRHAGCKNLCVMCVLIATEALWCQTKTCLWQRPGCSQETHKHVHKHFFFLLELENWQYRKTSDVTWQGTQVKVNSIEGFVECMSNLPIRPLICLRRSSINGTVTDPCLCFGAVPSPQWRRKGTEGWKEGKRRRAKEGKKKSGVRARLKFTFCNIKNKNAHTVAAEWLFLRSKSLTFWNQEQTSEKKAAMYSMLQHAKHLRQRDQCFIWRIPPRIK